MSVGRNALLVSAVATILLAGPAIAAGLPPNLLGGGSIRSGEGSRVMSFNVKKSGPLALFLGAGGSSNVVAHVSGPSGKELLVNEIGPYAGITLYPYAKPGRYRLALQAPGAWKATVQSWGPHLAGGLLLSTFKERGDYVYMGSLKRASEPVVTARCTCEGNFVVMLRDFSGNSELLVNEIGNYKGQVLAPALNPGAYLLEVQADGPWTVRITR